MSVYCTYRTGVCMDVVLVQQLIVACVHYTLHVHSHFLVYAKCKSQSTHTLCVSVSSKGTLSTCCSYKTNYSTVVTSFIIKINTPPTHTHILLNIPMHNI